MSQIIKTATKKVNLNGLSQILNDPKDWLSFKNRFQSRILHALIMTQKEMVSMVHRHFHKNEANGEYGLYPNLDVLEFVYVLTKLGKFNVLDCGAGIGAFLMIAKAICEELRLPFIGNGFENFKPYVNNRVHSVEHKDLFSIDTKDIKKYEVFYFWEPFSNPKNGSLFFDKLRFNMSNRQWVVCKSNQFLNYLREHNLPYVMFNGYTITTAISTCPDTQKQQRKVELPTHGDLITQ